MDQTGLTQAYRGMDAATLEREYNARASVPDFEAEYADYVRLSAATIARFHRIADIVYDPATGSTLDVYPAGLGSPVFVWIHGGYWRALSKDENAFVADGLVPHGVSVVNVNYTLAPAASLDEITRQVGAAVAWTVRHASEHGFDGSRVHVGGSSAGGHLVGSLLTAGRMAALGLPADTIASATALSGLFDLEPLRFTPTNEWLHLDAAAARRNSPLFDLAANPARLLISYGGHETAEFQRQSRAFMAAWQAAGNVGRTVAMPDHNHFNIAVALATAGTDLHTAVLETIVAKR